MGSEPFASIIRSFPGLAELSSEGADVLAGLGEPRVLPGGKTLANPGNRCESFLLLTAGEVRVHMTTEQGRELTLYRMVSGEACILTASCLIAARRFPAWVETTRPSEGFAVPAQHFLNLYEREAAWRNLVFGGIAQRLGQVLEVIDGVMFAALPNRLAEFLLRQQAGQPVTLSHEEIAREVGSTREVISRTLKSWERSGIVALARRRIDILDPETLLASSEH